MDRQALQRPHLSQLCYFVIAIIFILMLSSPTSSIRASNGQKATTGDWSTYLYSISRSGFNSNETIINAGTAANLKLHWLRQRTAQIVSEPVLANGLVYWGSYDGLEHASDPQTGIDVCATYTGQSTF